MGKYLITGFNERRVALGLLNRVGGLAVACVAGQPV
jgi:hypothetical protein